VRSISTPTLQIVSAAFGSSAAIASSSNGGLPSGRSRSPGFDVENKQAPSSSSGDAAAAAAANAAAAAFLSGATVGSSAAAGTDGGGGGWLGGGADDFSAAAVGRKEAVDHAFAGAMLQRSTSAPPVSDHVRFCRDVKYHILDILCIEPPPHPGRHLLDFAQYFSE